MRKLLATTLALLTFSAPAFADDVSDNSTVVTRFGKAFINSRFRGTHGILPPKGTTAQRDSTSAEGLFRYSMTDHKAEVYNGSVWTQLTAGYLNTQTTQVATGANTTETDGVSYTLPANSLSANGKGVKVIVWGTCAANGNDKTVKLYFGGTSVYTTGAVAANAKNWKLELVIIRTGVGGQKIFTTGDFNGAVVNASNITTATKDETGALIIKNTMTNGTASASDISTEGMLVQAIM